MMMMTLRFWICMPRMRQNRPGCNRWTSKHLPNWHPCASGHFTFRCRLSLRHNEHVRIRRRLPLSAFFIPSHEDPFPRQLNFSIRHECDFEKGVSPSIFPFLSLRQVLIPAPPFHSNVVHLSIIASYSDIAHRSDFGGECSRCPQYREPQSRWLSTQTHRGSASKSGRNGADPD
jgi:hypothetical protein